MERQLPSLQSGRHPLHIKCRDFMIITLSLLKDGEAQDVFDSIQKLACVSKLEIYKLPFFSLINQHGM